MKKQNNARRKMISRLSVLLTMLLLTVVAVSSENMVQAGQNEGKVTLTVEQKIVMEESSTSGTEQEFTYVLETVEMGNPLPEGNDGNSYTFSQRGNQSVTLGEIVFTRPGEYRYRLFLKNEVSQYQCDQEIYDIIVYVYQADNMEIKCAVVATDQTGYKSDSLRFTHRFVGIKTAVTEFQVVQTLETNGAVLSDEEQEFVYLLKAQDTKNPMPEKVNGDSYVFTIGGSDYLNIAPITFTQEGEYRYQIYLKEIKDDPAFTCDLEVYDLVVKVPDLKDEAWTLSANKENVVQGAVTIFNQAGEQSEEVVFHHIYKKTEANGGGQLSGNDKEGRPTVKNAGMAAVKTGDLMHPIFWLVVVVIAAGLIIGLYRRKRNRLNEE